MFAWPCFHTQQVQHCANRGHSVQWRAQQLCLFAACTASIFSQHILLLGYALPRKCICGERRVRVARENEPFPFFNNPKRKRVHLRGRMIICREFKSNLLLRGQAEDHPLSWQWGHSWAWCVDWHICSFPLIINFIKVSYYFIQWWWQCGKTCCGFLPCSLPVCWKMGKIPQSIGAFILSHDMWLTVFV